MLKKLTTNESHNIFCDYFNVLKNTSRTVPKLIFVFFISSLNHLNYFCTNIPKTNNGTISISFFNKRISRFGNKNSRLLWSGTW